MTDQEPDDDVQRWLAADQPPEPGNDFWTGVDAMLGSTEAATDSGKPRSRRQLAIAAVIVAVLGGLVGAFVAGLEWADPVVVASDPDGAEVARDEAAESTADSMEEVEVTSPPQAAATPVPIETTGEASRFCSADYELSVDRSECFLLGTPTFATDVPVCGEGVVAAALDPVDMYASGATRTGRDVCLVERVSAFEPQIPFTAGACPPSHPHHVVELDEPGPGVCLLPGPAPAGLFATAVDGAGELIRLSASDDSIGASRLAFVDGMRSVPVFDEPGGPMRMLQYEYLDGTRYPFALANPTYFGEPLVLRVVEVDETGEWLRVHPATRPGQRSTWVQASSFSLGLTNFAVEVDVGENLLWIFESDGVETNGDGADEVLHLESIVVSGRADRPTPLEPSYVTETIPGPSPAYGSFVLWIAAFSNDLNTFSGGVPQQRIHGTNHPEQIGERISSGAIRVPNDVIEIINELIRPGTPVLLYDSRTSATDRDAIVAMQPDQPAPTVPFDPAFAPLAPG